MNKSMHFLYFKKVFISFSLFGCLLPVEASTYNLLCTPYDSHQISYIDKEDLIKSKVTEGRKKYKEIKTKKKFKVSFNLKDNSGFIENNPAKAIRIFSPGPYEKAPVFLYFSDANLNTVKTNEDGDNRTLRSIKSIESHISIGRPTDSSTSFVSIESLEQLDEIESFNESFELTEDIETIKTKYVISNGRCVSIK